MELAPKVVYGADTLPFELSQKPWTPSSRMIGGGDRSSARVPETFEIRRDYLLEVRLRFPEGAWQAVSEWLEYGQRGGVFDFYPDQDIATSYPCYLEKPGVGDEIAPNRSNEPSTFEISVTLLTTNGTQIAPEYFG